jgi:hypothetical protein
VNGLTINEYQTPTNLKNRINLSGSLFPNTIELLANVPATPVRLTMGGSANNVNILANNGLVIGNSGNSGTSLQLRHTIGDNWNIIGNANGAGPEILFNPDALNLSFRTGSGNDIIIGNTTDNILINKVSSGETDTFSQGGLTMTNALGTGRVGLFNGIGMDLASDGPISIRTNLTTTPLTNMTAFQNGTVLFPSTITASAVNTTQLVTATNLTVKTNIFGTPNNTAVFNQNGTVDFLSTITAPKVNTNLLNTLSVNTTLLNADIVSTGTLRANTISTININSINGNITTLDTNQINNLGSIFTGTLGATTGNITTVNTGAIDAPTSLLIRTNVNTTPYNTITANANGTVSFLSTISAPRANITTGSFNTVNTTNMNTLNGSISTLNAGAITTSTLTVTTTASIPVITNLATLNTFPIASYFVPVGCVFPFAGLLASVPSGYLLCNGQTVSQTTYSILYGIIGDNYNISGASPAGQFALPDLRTKTAIGASNSGVWGNFFFFVTGGTFDTLAGSVPPSPYVARQCIYVSDTADGCFVTKGQTLTFGAETKNIVGVINTTGSDQNVGLVNAYVIVLDSALSVAISGGTLIQINDTNNTCAMGKTRYGNLTIQNGNEVGIHTHGTVATSSSNNTPLGNGRSEPNFSQPINQPNGNYTGNNGTVYTLPFSMNTMPSAVFMNYIIKY